MTVIHEDISEKQPLGRNLTKSDSTVKKINLYSANTLFIENITTNNAANHYTCRFTRDLNVTKTTKTKAGDTYTKTFDLEEGKKWNVFIAKGKMNKDVIQYHQYSELDGNTATFRRGLKFGNQIVQNTTVW